MGDTKEEVKADLKIKIGERQEYTFEEVRKITNIGVKISDNAKKNQEIKAR